MDDGEAISIHVKNPRTHIRKSWWNNCYTDYEIAISSHHSIVFAKQTSKTRRRYSEFVWLQKQLSRHASITTRLPVLPKRKIFGKFDNGFLEKRRQGLEQYLVSVVQITPFLSDVALHVFLQTDLSVKHMDDVLSGKDSREIAEIICPEKMLVQQRSTQAKKCSTASARDSGYSGSSIHDENTGIVAQGTASWPSLYVNYANCQIMGNGWSSGCTGWNSGYTGGNSGYNCASQTSTGNGSKHATATVLPSGQLVLPQQGMIDNSLNSDSQSQNNDEYFRAQERENYDADNETDSAQSDYDVIRENKRLHVCEWLNSSLAEDYDQCDSSDEEAEPSPNALCVPEYDIISVPCSKGELPMRCSSSQSAVHPRDEGSGSESGDSDSFGKPDGFDADSCSYFSVLHSSIDGLDFKDRDELSASCHSSCSCSAAVFNSYDVVEMIELKYLHVI